MFYVLQENLFIGVESVCMRVFKVCVKKTKEFSFFFFFDKKKEFSWVSKRSENNNI
jgi:hypothetical protein